ncbi:hypothetical protein FRB90_005088 [Tulasnella sp. 427]|nr:hypothetical protein FRB90_005088 [Tulasnella sp. 427]
MQELMRDSWSAEAEPAAPEPECCYPGQVRRPPKEFWKVDSRAQPLRFDEPGGDKQDEPESDEQPVDSPAPAGGDQNTVSEEEEQDASESEADSVLQALETVYPDEELLTHDEAIECCYNQLSEQALKVAADSTEPRSFREAMSRPDKDKWLEAAQTEIRAHI